MQTLIFATNNKHKIEEATHILLNKYHITSLKEIGYDKEIPETANTLEGNASLKAWEIYNTFKKDCFADDTGLEVEALNGEPGVFSARYAFDAHDFNANIDKLLKNLINETNRKARFRTIISLIINGSEKQFEGIINGEIINERRGKEGFGYDPVFIPDGYTITIAEMPSELKNKISHRAIALQKMADFLI